MLPAQSRRVCCLCSFACKHGGRSLSRCRQPVGKEQLGNFDTLRCCLFGGGGGRYRFIEVEYTRRPWLQQGAVTQFGRRCGQRTATCVAVPFLALTKFSQQCTGGFLDLSCLPGGIHRYSGDLAGQTETNLKSDREQPERTGIHLKDLHPHASVRSLYTQISSLFTAPRADSSVRGAPSWESRDPPPIDLVALPILPSSRCCRRSKACAIPVLRGLGVGRNIPEDGKGLRSVRDRGSEPRRVHHQRAAAVRERSVSSGSCVSACRRCC